MTSQPQRERTKALAGGACSEGAGDQSREGRENTPTGGTNHERGERIYGGRTRIRHAAQATSGAMLSLITKRGEGGADIALYARRSGGEGPQKGKLPKFLGNAHPGEGNAHPGEGNAHPGEGNAHPGDGNAHPGEGNAHPGEGNAHPGEGTRTPGRGDSHTQWKHKRTYDRNQGAECCMFFVLYGGLLRLASSGLHDASAFATLGHLRTGDAAAEGVHNTPGDPPPSSSTSVHNSPVSGFRVLVLGLTVCTYKVRV
eukprot:1187150-Prorocentrum_minimum.AAC.1